MPLVNYIKIKDNYCIGYFGENINIINELKKTKYLIEKDMPGINIFICLLDQFVNDLFQIKKSELLNFKKNFSAYQELVSDDPIKELLQ